MALRLALGAALLLLACGTDRDELLLVGTVERTLVELAAPTSEEIVEIPVERGDRVEPGALLVRLDATYAEAEIARAQAMLAAARTATLVAQQDLERAERLHRSRVASPQDLDRARLARDEATARLREAGAIAVVAQKGREDLFLVAPRAGVVDQFPFDEGERVPAGAVLAVMQTDATPWIRVWIPEWSFALVRPGTPAQISIDGLEGTFEGTVTHVSREAEFTPHYALTERDRVHLVYETRVLIEDAPDDLRPGIPAQARILADQAALVAAP